MKKRLFLLAVFVFLTCSLAAQDIPTYELELVRTIGIGDGFDELMYFTALTTGVFPQVIKVFDDDTIIIFDQGKARLLYIHDNDFREILIQRDQLWGFWDGYSFLFTEDGLWGCSSYDISAIDYNGNILINILGQAEFSHHQMIPYSNYIFRRNKQHEMICFTEGNPSSYQNEDCVLHKNEILALFESGNKPPELGGLEMDEESGRLYLNGELYTYDYYDFFTHFRDLYGDGYRDLDEHFYKPGNENSSLYFIGRDNDENWYWYSKSSRGVIIFNNEGILINAFLVDKELVSSIPPTVHPNGDLYFLGNGWGRDEVELYRITRRW